MLFDLFLFADYFGARQQFRQAFVIRLMVITPVCLLVTTAAEAHRDTAVVVAPAARAVACARP